MRWRLLREMVREEWRLHTHLFGGARFGLFPVLILAFTGGAAWLLDAAGTDPGTVLDGAHVLVLVLGLHTGTVGLVGRDALENLLGDVTFLVYSGRTLPLADRDLLAAFLGKDLLYYAGLFLLPVALGLGLLVDAPVLPRVALLVATLAATFMLGVVLTLGLIALAARHRVLPVAAAVGLLVAAGLRPDLALAWSPLGWWRAPSPAAAARALTPVVLLGAAGVLGFRRRSARRPRTARASLGGLQRVLPGDRHGLVARSLLDVARSSGGVVKVVFSTGLLFALVLLMMGMLRDLVGLAPRPGVTFGTLLSLGAFTTYNWLTQFDDVGDYLILPLDVGDVLGGKLRAFLLLHLPVAYVLLAASAVLVGPDGLLVGALVLPGLSLLLYGVTVHLAGFDPSTFLFDTPLFLAFAGVVSLAVVPLLVAAFLPDAGWWTTDPVLVAWSLLAGAAGVGLARRAVPRWTDRILDA